MPAVKEKEIPIEVRAAQQRLDAYADSRTYAPFRPFCVTFHLSTPIAGYAPVHLDAVVMAALITEATCGEMLPDYSGRYTVHLPLEVLWEDLETGAMLYNTSDFVPDGARIDGIHWWTKKTEATKLSTTPPDTP